MFQVKTHAIHNFLTEMSLFKYETRITLNLFQKPSLIVLITQFIYFQVSRNVKNIKSKFNLKIFHYNDVIYL